MKGANRAYARAGTAALPGCGGTPRPGPGRGAIPAGRADGSRCRPANLVAVTPGKPGGSRLRVAVRVTPGSPRAVVGGRRGDALVVRVTARPAGGAATRAALRAAADAFGVPGSHVTLVTGATSRDKLIEIAGPAGPLARRLQELLGSCSDSGRNFHVPPARLGKSKP